MLNATQINNITIVYLGTRTFIQEPFPYPRGGTRSIHDRGGPTYFFGLKIYTLGSFFGSRDLSRIFLGLIKKYAYFFGSYLRANFSFWVFVAISGSEKYSFELFFSDVCPVFLYFFGLEILMPGIFLGLKFQACVFFWVCNMKLRRTPPSCILRVPPWVPYPSLTATK